MRHYPDKRHLLKRRLDVLAHRAHAAFSDRYRPPAGVDDCDHYERSLRRYFLLCRRWRLANHQLALLDNPRPSKVYDEAAAQLILDYFRDLPAAAIDQAQGQYQFTVDTPREELEPPCQHCVGVHLAYLLELPAHEMSGGRRFLSFSTGDVALTIVCDERRQWSHGAEALVHHLLQVCGAPYEPFSQDPWETHPAIVFERFFQKLL